jgi:hypothetical protein
MMRPVGSNPPPFEPPRPPAMPEGSPPPTWGAPPPHMGPPPGMGMPPPMPSPAPLAAPYPPPFPMAGTPSVRPRWISVVVIVALVATLGAVAAVAGFLIHRSLKETGTGSTVASGAVVTDAASTAPSPTDDAERAVVAPGDAEAAAIAGIDAGETVIDPPIDADAAADPATDVVDAGGEAATPDPSDKLVIHSTPPGAIVYIDGAAEGKTPVTIAGSSDRHTLAIFLAGHDLYLAEVDGTGAHDAKLVAISPPEGPGGIKVRCKVDDRYYVYLVGKPTGQL